MAEGLLLLREFADKSSTVLNTLLQTLSDTDSELRRQAGLMLVLLTPSQGEESAAITPQQYRHTAEKLIALLDDAVPKLIIIHDTALRSWPTDRPKSSGCCCIALRTITLKRVRQG